MATEDKKPNGALYGTEQQIPSPEKISVKGIKFAMAVDLAPLVPATFKKLEEERLPLYKDLDLVRPVFEQAYDELLPHISSLSKKDSPSGRIAWDEHNTILIIQRVAKEMNKGTVANMFPDRILKAANTLMAEHNNSRPQRRLRARQKYALAHPEEVQQPTRTTREAAE